MSYDRTAALLERVAELIVLAEPGDAPSLEAVAMALREVAAVALSEGASEVARVAGAAAAHAGRLARGELAGDATSLGVLGDRLREMRAALQRPAATSPDEDEELLAEFVVKAGEHLDTAEAALLGIDGTVCDADSVDAVFRAFHTIKGMTGFLSLEEIRALAHDGESLLEDARDGADLDAATIDAALVAVDAIRDAVAGLTGSVPAPDDGQQEARQSSRADGGAARCAERESVRVDAERLDQLLDAIGEIVIAESMASRTARIEAGESPLLEQQLGRLDKLTRQLHEMAASLRMIPMRPTFQRLARAVRDLARQSGKEVAFVMSGEDTELDKAVVDNVGDCLVHLVRNAVDHGLESRPDERVAAGKPIVGRIEVRAYHKAGSIYVEVADDGRGLPRQAILERARALRLVEDEQPSDRDLLALICRPGFSTSHEVTDVSGRGVGMDVVKRTVEGLGGQVSIRSEEGRGCTFVMRLPVTLAVIDGMTVRVGDERYIVPTLSVVRSLRPSPDSVTSVLGTGEMLDLDEELLRLIRLHRLFDSGTEPSADEAIVMVVEDEGRRAGLVIDEIVGQQQIVIKSLGEALGEVTGVSGGAVMPDGRVGLILDVEGLVALANEA